MKTAKHTQNGDSDTELVTRIMGAHLEPVLQKVCVSWIFVASSFTGQACEHLRGIKT